MAQHNRSRRSQSPGTPEQDFIEAFFRGLWQVITFIFKRGPKGPAAGEQAARLAEIRDQWQTVEMHLMQPSMAPLAVSEADKLLDASLQALGFPGATMGERLKAAVNWFPADLYQRLWDAHKLRNTLAHEVGASARPHEAQAAVDAIRTALYHLKVLS